MNFKKITDIPVLEEILDGDMLVVNHGGAAAQIDASKVGGSGGSDNAGQVLYVGINDEALEGGGTVTGMAFIDSNFSTQPTAAEGFEILCANPRMLASIDSSPRVIVPSYVFPPTSSGTILCGCTLADGLTVRLVLYFSDTNEA